MKTPEEIKKGLEPCGDKSDCEWCEFAQQCDIEADALAYIQQLEADKVSLLESSHEMRKEMISKIKQLEAKVPRWISFDEEKPPVCERIWCFGEYNGEPFAYGDIAFENGNTLYAAIYKPTHWMPLPEPPVKETEAEHDGR